MAGKSSKSSRRKQPPDWRPASNNNNLKQYIDSAMADQHQKIHPAGSNCHEMRKLSQRGHKQQQQQQRRRRRQSVSHTWPRLSENSNESDGEIMNDNERPMGCSSRQTSTNEQQINASSSSKIVPQRPGTLKQKQALLALLAFALMSLSFGRVPPGAEARITFEKMTNRDYSGLNYYSIQNVSLFECLGWCKDESSCTSAVFSFVVNPFAALQETTCMLQNETAARQGAYLRTTSQGEQITVAAQPQKATNLYFFNKIELQSESVCSRLWAFERFPNRRLRQQRATSAMAAGAFHAPNKEACQAACMNEPRFVCRSLEYNYLSQQCALSAHDRRSPLVQHLSALSSAHGSLAANDLVESSGTDYFENACLLGEDICNESRIYDYAKLSGLAQQRVAHFVELNYYPDKEMLVKSQAGCVRACTIEHEFICRSILYRSSFKQGQPNCALYHLDQRTFPEGADAFLGHTMQPLLDSGDTSAVYLEAVCNDTIAAAVAGNGPSTPASLLGSTSTMSMPPASISILPSSTTPSGVSIFASNHSQPGELERFVLAAGGPTSTLSPPTTIRLPTNFGGGGGGGSLPAATIPSSIQIDASASTVHAGNNGRLPTHITISPAGQPSGAHHQRQPIGAQLPSHITISPAPGRDTSTLTIEPGGSALQPANGAQQHNHDQNCDAHGFCYDVALKCTDTKMVVNVRTQRPFFGRIYALGRSETCNANIKNQNQFQLDMWLSGQECNTQSASGTYTNTIVLQHHNVVLTKADKVYHVRCTYETASRNVSFGMMPVKDMFEVDVNDRNQETISITSTSDAPLPKISILTLEGKEASTVRIGDRLTFKIEIPDNTPYGIFARSCVAMAKDARSTFEIIDEHGCPVDHTIFPHFLPSSQGNALESNYEAFRFTESYGVIFQCNVKYCIGKCEPVNCGIGRDSVDSWGRRKRSIGDSGNAKVLADDMTLSREIVVLDLKEKEAVGESRSAGATDQLRQPGASGDTLLSADGAGAAQRPRTGAAAAAAHKSTSVAESDNSSSNNGGDGDDELGDRHVTAPNLHCLSSQSLLLIVCSIGLFFVLYVCVVAYFFARRDPKMSVIKHQYH